MAKTDRCISWTAQIDSQSVQLGGKNVFYPSNTVVHLATRILLKLIVSESTTTKLSKLSVQSTETKVQNEKNPALPAPDFPGNNHALAPSLRHISLYLRPSSLGVQRSWTDRSSMIQDQDDTVMIQAIILI